MRLHFVEQNGDGRAGLLEISCLLVNTAAISSSVTEDSKRHWQLLIKLHVVYGGRVVWLSLSLMDCLHDMGYIRNNMNQ